MFENLLIYLLNVPILGVLILMAIPANKRRLLKILALNFSSLPFFGFLIIWAFFKKSIAQFQFVTKIFWMPYFNLNLILGVDGISLFFLLLTTLLIPICILISWYSVKKDLKEYLIAFLILEFFLIGVFSILDLLLFYIFFESVLIPMGRILGFFGFLQSWMYWFIVINITQGKSLFNYEENGNIWMINGSTFFSIKGLIQLMKSSNKWLSLVHYVLTNSISSKLAKGLCGHIILIKLTELLIFNEKVSYVM